MSTESSNLQLAALQLAAACASMGGSGSLETRVEAPQWLYLDGWLIPVNGGCSLTADGGAVQINSDLGAATLLASDQNHWSLAEGLSGPWTANASGGLARGM